MFSNCYLLSFYVKYRYVLHLCIAVFRIKFHWCIGESSQPYRGSFLVHSTTHIAPYIHPSHDLILKLWRTFPNDRAKQDSHEK